MDTNHTFKPSASRRWIIFALCALTLISSNAWAALVVEITLTQNVKRPRPGVENWNRDGAPRIEIKNLSTDAVLVRSEMTITRDDFFFDEANNLSNGRAEEGASGATQVISAITPLGENGSMSWNFDLKKTRVDATPLFTFEDTLLGDNPAKLKLFFEQNGVLQSKEFTLSGKASRSEGRDGSAKKGVFTYSIKPGDGQNPKTATLTIISDGPNVFVERSNGIRLQGEPVAGEPTKTLFKNLVDGDLLKILSPERTYYKYKESEFRSDLKFEIAGVITDSTGPRRRYQMNGIKLTGELLSEGQVLDFRFDGQDTVATVLWDEDVPIYFSQDFTGTKPNKDPQSELGLDLESKRFTAGQPEVIRDRRNGQTQTRDPVLGVNWIPKGTEARLEIDRDILELRFAPQEARYRILATEFTGGAEAQCPMPSGGGRIELLPKNYTATEPLFIKTVWKIEYAVNLPTPLGGKAEDVELIVGEKAHKVAGEEPHWIDMSSSKNVTVRAKLTGSDQLNGWLRGDGFYFDYVGTLVEVDGILSNETGRDPGREDGDESGPKLTGDDLTGDFYSLEISSLERPLTVQFTYGTRDKEKTIEIGRFVDADNLATAEETERYDQQPTVEFAVASPGAGADVLATPVWDSDHQKLYLVQPGRFVVTKAQDDTGNAPEKLIVVSVLPSTPSFNYVARSPGVALNGDQSNATQPKFDRLGWTAHDATVDGLGRFSAQGAGYSTLVFTEVASGRDLSRGGVRVSTVETQLWQDQVAETGAPVTIGTKVTDQAADQAGFGTGFVINALTRHNTSIYDPSVLEGFALPNPTLPGPVIPVNLFPSAPEAGQFVVVWYERKEGILWPYTAKKYKPAWPELAETGVITIASEFGSESQIWEDETMKEQEVIIGSGEFTYRPDLFQDVQIYNQPDRDRAGYNPNEEHALIAPSLRFADVSPRPFAGYALRDGDLNRWVDDGLHADNQKADHTSFPRVLMQFFDVEDGEHKMRVYQIQREDLELHGKAGAAGNYRFAAKEKLIVDPDTEVSPSDPGSLNVEPFVRMEAGEPVIAFYPLGVANGASPCPETFGEDLLGQRTYWEDHRGANWSVSGGDSAWFTSSFHYRLAPDFWWPQDEGGAEAGVVRETRETETIITDTFVPNDEGVLVETRVERLRETVRQFAARAEIGSCIPFLPNEDHLDQIRARKPGSQITFRQFLDDVERMDLRQDEFGLLGNYKPTKILYKSDWPKVAPVLKSGETLTYQGGEFRADHPTSIFVDEGGITREVETPGLPGIVGFAAAEVVFDLLNPKPDQDLWTGEWTARVAQVLEKRDAPLPLSDFPPELNPASGRVRVSSGQYIFNDLPASLQRRLRYDPIRGTVQFRGLLNDKEIGDNTLTASPPAVYALEPNILTEDDRILIKGLDNDEGSQWDQAIDVLFRRTRNPGEVGGSTSAYFVGLEKEIVPNEITGLPELTPIEPGSEVTVPLRRSNVAAPLRAFGPGLALIPNDGFLDPNEDYPDVSWITVVENNDPSLGGSPITPHVIKVDRRERYRGSIKTIESDNVFDENLVLRHTGDFGAHADELFFEWYYRPDDGQLNVPPPDRTSSDAWKLFPDPTGKAGRGMYEITMKGNPNAPETLLSDTFWFVRYRHQNDLVNGTNWKQRQPDGADEVNFDWAGAGNSDPFNDFDLNGEPDYRAQLAPGWVKRVLDAVNPYEARIRDFETENPSTKSSMLALFGARYEGPVALNPDKNVIENVGLIELYETVIKRARDLSIDLTRPVSTPGVANALQLASTRIADFYTILGNEAYTDSLDPTIGFGSDSVEYGSLAPAVFAFQNQLSSSNEEGLALLRGVDDFFARPVYNRLFWNLTKGEGEAAYAGNYNLSDINFDGFINEDDAMILYPQGHGDAWGHYLTAVRSQYELLAHPNFNWVSRSEFYNLQDIVMKVDFLDERKFAQAAATKAKTGAEIVDLTYREAYVEDPTSQWAGYTDANRDRSWGVDGWATRAGQGAYFDWVTANALLPSKHPNENLEGIQKVDRTTNSDIAVISAQMNRIQRTFDEANEGHNPLGLAGNVVPFDIDPARIQRGQTITATHFEQVYEKTVASLGNVAAVWDNANQSRNMLRKIANSESDFRNKTFQEDLSFRNRQIKIFGRPYEGTIGSGRTYPPGYDGPDSLLFMYANVREITDRTVPGPSLSFAEFSGNQLTGGEIFRAFVEGEGGPRSVLDIGNDTRALFSPTLAFETNINDNFEGGDAPGQHRDGWYNVEYTDLVDPKVPLDNFTQLMPVTAAGYTFQAPDAWGSRLATGELQVVIGKMIQQEARVARAIGDWDALTGEIGREFRLLNARRQRSKELQTLKVTLASVNSAHDLLVSGIETALAIKKIRDNATESALENTINLVNPNGTPAGVLGTTPGGAIFLPPLAAAQTAALTDKTAKDVSGEVLEAKLRFADTAFLEALSEIDLIEDSIERTFGTKEALVELEGLFGDEPIKRIEVFREIETLRELSERYVTLLDEGSRLVDERMAFNKRVAAQTQRNRYQDMTFRVSRNHALQTYHDAFEVAARYAYQAAKAYDYETNFPAGHPASPDGILKDIVSARSLGHFEGGQPRLGKGGLCEALATLKANYEAQKGQLGFNNPQSETGKLSLRTELLRILPKGSTQPDGNSNPLQLPQGQSDDLWRLALEKARVNNLWEVAEFREHCRPFATTDEGAQPGLVFRFPISILAGKNVFGKRLAGGDHAYDASNFATKIRSAGVWFSGYQSDDLLADLAETPRVYLVPIGADIMRVPDGGDNTDSVRIWDVLDQKIPVPFPSRTADMEDGSWIPLLDGLNGRFGETRRFSSFRAYHDGSESVDEDELVFDSRLVGRSVWNTEWMLIIPGQTLNHDAEEGIDKFIYGPGSDPAQPDGGVSDIKLIFQTYGYSGG